MLPSPHSQDLLLMMLNQGLLRLLVCPYVYVAIFSDLYVICWIGFTSSSSSMHKQQAQAWLCRATGICRGLHHPQLSPADTGMAAQCFWQQLQRTSSSSAVASGPGHGCAVLLAAAAEDVLIFKYSQAAGSGVAAQSSWHLQRTSAVSSGLEHGRAVLLAAAAEDVLIFKVLQAAGSA